MNAFAENKIWNEPLWQATQGQDAPKEARARAWNQFLETGFPSPKEESWRYTSTAFVASQQFQRTPSPKLDAGIFEHLKNHLEPFKNSARLIFLDGWWAPQLSDLKPIEASIDFSSMRDVAVHRPDALNIDQEKRMGFSAMNAALFQDGVWLRVHPGVQLDVPLLIYFLQTSSTPNQTVQLRHRISLGEKSALKVVEWHNHLHQMEMFSNQEMDIQLAPSSRLEHLRFQQAGMGTWSRSSSDVTLEQKSHYSRLDFEVGAKVSRNEIQVHLKGTQARCLLKGVGLGRSAQHFDTQVTMEHLVPEASSDQVYRNLLAGEARGVFGGRVRVFPDAQKTDARQVHKTLLLSEGARADTKPQLEIDADDVQCSHGAAIGQLDEDSLFYLQSRGISRLHAEQMLASGFVETIFDSIACSVLQTFFKARLKEQLLALF